MAIAAEAVPARADLLIAEVLQNDAWTGVIGELALLRPVVIGTVAEALIASAARTAPS